MKINKLAGNFRGVLLGSCISALLGGSAISAHAQTFSVLYQFPNTGGLGDYPSQMTMVEGTDGNYYGTTFYGGDSTNYSGGGGTVFNVSPSGQLTQLWAFCAQSGCPDGRSPEGGVVQASDRNFYGTTYGGGTYNQGTIYKITPAGALTTLYSFCWYPNTCTPYSGSGPYGQLVQASNGAIYGTTTAGTAFRINLKGKFKLIYTWPTGAGPYGALLQVGRALYGTTAGGGTNAIGTVFKMSRNGKVTTLYSFGSQSSCADGQAPEAGLVQGADGNLYGTTSAGGTSGCGGYGTVFKITPKGRFTSLVSFQAGTTPANPYAPLVLAGDGTLYGTTAYGGNSTYGTVFQIAKGALANVYPLGGSSNCTGGHPFGGLLLASNGNFYGSDAGACGSDGTLFEFSTAAPAKSASTRSSMN